MGKTLVSLKNNETAVTAVTAVSSNSIKPQDEGLSEKSKEYFHGAKAKNTQKTYSRLWNIFQAWCFENDRVALPALSQTIVDFISYQASEKNIAHISIIVYLAAIRLIHINMGFDPPPTSSSIVSSALAGIKKKHPRRSNQKQAITIDELERMIALCPSTLRGLRDAALLSFHFSLAMRCSEPVSITLENIEFTDDGAIVYLVDSKTGAAELPLINIERINAVDHLKRWLWASKITSGYVFRKTYINGSTGSDGSHLSSRTVQELWKHYAKKIGLDVSRISGHSARAGFATEALMSGADEFDVMDITRHKTTTMLKKYKRKRSMFISHAGRKIR